MLSNHLILYRPPLLPPSVKLCAMPCIGQVIRESPDKTCSPGGGWQTTPILLPPPHALSPSYLFLAPLALEALTFSSLFPAGLRFLPISWAFFFFCPFIKKKNKALTDDSCEVMARKTALLHWHFKNIAQWLGTHLFLPLPSIFALWLLTFAPLTPHSVLLHVHCLAARVGLVSLIYCI